MKRGLCKVLVALGAHLAFWGWSVDEADAQVLRWRTNGTECPFEQLITTVDQESFGSAAHAGKSFFDRVTGNSSSFGATCFIPTGRDLLELHNTNGRRISHVNLRLHQIGAVTETTGVSLVASDFVASQFCLCDYKQRTGSAGTFFMSVSFASCIGCAGTDWSLGLDMFMTDNNSVATKALKVRLVSAYSN
ncbi:MAG: hypothetical protein KF718_03620 [Polyangiaceae bacterium]|nr:hypothetical protein [Polyangiaceae bacterium]